MEKGKIKFAVVVWWDAFAWSDEFLEDTNFSPHYIISSGYLIEENKDKIVISRDFYPDVPHMVRSVIAIPKGIVVDIKYEDLEFDIEFEKQEEKQDVS